MAIPNTDYIQLRNIQLPLPISIAPDAWHRSNTPQPATISVRIAYPASLISQAAKLDNVAFTLNYGTLYRAIEKNIRSKNDDQYSADGQIIGRGMNVVEAAETISDTAHKLLWHTVADTETSGNWDPVHDEWVNGPNEEVEVLVHLPKGVLRAEAGLKCKLLHGCQGKEEAQVEFKIEGIKCYCVVGVNDHERREKQGVELSLKFQFLAGGPGCAKFLDCYQKLTRNIAEFVDHSSFQTVEALATIAAEIATLNFGLDEVTVSVEKPSAMGFVEYSGIEITRNASFFKNSSV